MIREKNPNDFTQECAVARFTLAVETYLRIMLCLRTEKKKQIKKEKKNASYFEALCCA